MNVIQLAQKQLLPLDVDLVGKQAKFMYMDPDCLKFFSYSEGGRDWQLNPGQVLTNSSLILD